VTVSWSILHQLVAVSCPACGFSFEVQIIDVRVQAYRMCPCCRVRIHLVDEGGSSRDIDDVGRAIENVGASLKHIARS